MKWTPGSTLLDEAAREIYRERFEKEYVRVADGSAGPGSRAERRAGARRARLHNDGRARQ